MSTLFKVDPVFPEGFFYTPDFISVQEEEQLLSAIKELELKNFTFQGYTANRKIASFGYDYSFDNGKLQKGAEIPPVFGFLVEKVSRSIQKEATEFAELLVTEYPPGAVINWHRDAPPFGLIAGVSLFSDCTFRLRPFDKKQQNRSSIISFKAARRSLYVMQGASRAQWQHSISPVKDLRYSITLRTLRS